MLEEAGIHIIISSVTLPFTIDLHVFDSQQKMRIMIITVLCFMGWRVGVEGGELAAAVREETFNKTDESGQKYYFTIFTK